MGISFVVGVPDSLLRELSTAFSVEMPNEHIVAANEGCAVGFAIGHYLSTETPALVYMQNSGLGNAINPLVSLADTKIYGIPMILFIGWRGEMTDEGVQISDEPQHVKQGEITLEQLKTLGISYQIVNSTSQLVELTKNAYDKSKEIMNPVALVFRKNTFQAIESRSKASLISDAIYNLSREEVIKIIIKTAPSSLPIISTTGMASRELYEAREEIGEDHNSDFLTVGGMGHASSIAQGIAKNISPSKVICIDGDGALIMHMGSMIYGSKYENYIHIVINNGAHDSVGGQKTLADDVDLSEIALACGYKNIFSVKNKVELSDIISKCDSIDGSIFIEVKCKTGFRGNLGRPKESPFINREKFMQYLQDLKP